MKVAVNGCCHGELRALYANIDRMRDEENINVDLLICCGDFQTLRTQQDLQYFCAPQKYRVLKDFHEYFNGTLKAPVLTIFVGGNHEAPNVLRELYYGGWVAPNIFYMGHSGVVKVGGLRIAGISGIFNKQHYTLGHFERPPYNDSTARSAYHVRQFEMMKLHCVCDPVDIMISHDWPEGIYEYGDKDGLVRCKPHFREDILNHSLGSPPSMALLKSMKPSFWFSGHLHVGFSAVVPHEDGSATRFLALDKILPNRRFLQVLDIHPKIPEKYIQRAGKETNIATNLTIEYDLEWLAILRANQSNIWTSNERCNCHVICPSDDDRAAVLRNLKGLHEVDRRTPDVELSPMEEVDNKTAEAPCQDTSSEEEKLWPWPQWTDPPFQDLAMQRRRLLEILGFENSDKLGDKSRALSAGDSCTYGKTLSSELQRTHVPVKHVSEEIWLDFDSEIDSIVATCM